MAYAAESDALPYLRRVNLSASSIVTLADLDTFLAARANELDNALKARGIATPLTAQTAPAEFLATLVSWNAKGAAADVMNAFYVTNDGNDRGTGAVLLAEFKAGIAQILAGKIPVGAPVAEADLAPRSDYTDAPVLPSTMPWVDQERRGAWFRRSTTY